MTEIHIFVPGVPVPKGSAKSICCQGPRHCYPGQLRKAETLGIIDQLFGHAGNESRKATFRTVFGRPYILYAEAKGSLRYRQK